MQEKFDELKLRNYTKYIYK